MIWYVKFFGRSAALLLLTGGLLTACGGGSSDPTTAVVAVQLKKDSQPTLSYSVSQMTVSIQKSGGPVLTGVTNANGIAAISVSQTGTYQVIKVDGLDITGSADGSAGREFVKASPITTPVPRITYTPTTPPTANVTALNGGTVAVDIPVPVIRRVTVIKKGSISAGSNDNPSVSTSESAAFTGRVIVSNIHFTYTDGIILWGASPSSYHFTLTVNEAGKNINATLWNTAGNSLGDIAASVTSWPYTTPIILEVPSNSDWALGSGSTIYTEGGTGSLFDLLGNSVTLAIYNFGTTHTPAGTNALNYEIQRFDTI